MSTPLLGPSGPAVCFLCNTTDCNHMTNHPRGLTEEPPEMERTYRVTSPVVESGVIVLNVGQIIPLEEAVRRHLPGAMEMAGARMVRPHEDRAVHASEDR